MGTTVPAAAQRQLFRERSDALMATVIPAQPLIAGAEDRSNTSSATILGSVLKLLVGPVVFNDTPSAPQRRATGRTHARAVCKYSRAAMPKMASRSIAMWRAPRSRQWALPGRCRQ